MAYGIKLKDAEGNTLFLTSNISSLISIGTLYSPNELKSDSTYGVDVVIPQNQSVNENAIGVIIDHSLVGNIDVGSIHTTVSNGGNTYMMSWYMLGEFDFSYFTRNETTSVMTSWTPGNHSGTNFDDLLSIYFIGFWDKMGATSFNKVRLFSATISLAYDYSEYAWINAYALGNDGITGIDYAVHIGHYRGGKNYIQD